MAEVKFVAEITDPLTRDRKLCKIKCVEGQWIGPLCEQKDGAWRAGSQGLALAGGRDSHEGPHLPGGRLQPQPCAL